MQVARSPLSVMFILPGRGGGGGSHSVVQEVIGLARMGVPVAIASSRAHLEEFRASYPELAERGIANPAFDDMAELAAPLQDHALAIATTAPSAVMLAQAVKELPQARRPAIGYYVQDYEPLFMAPGSPQWQEAHASYTVNKRALLFAKTDWLCDIVGINHHVNVERVKASLDHTVYYPDLSPYSGPVRIAAMIRPKTPRRAPRRTARILERLSDTYGDRVQLTSFGCTNQERRASGLYMSGQVNHIGVLSRQEVARQLRQTDLFLDVSDYQAFGRTGLEGMACGAVPVLPVFGGVSEYARHRENAYVVDPRSDERILESVADYMADRTGIRQAMKMAGILTAQNYTVGAAALSEYKVFCSYLGL